MSQEIELPDNHRRHLSTMAYIVEESLDRMERLLTSKGVERATSRISLSYSEQERIRLLALVSRMRSVNEDIVHAFGLRRVELTERQVVRASLTHIWTVVLDSTSSGMKGFGPLPDDLAREVDARLAGLLGLLEECFEVK